MTSTTYTADIYLRLSKQDGDNIESDSIANQRDLILDYLQSHPEIKLHKIKIDDGRSGVDFNRPSFIEMIDDIKDGTVNCCIVKDFSRFGRNYIESGKYIQVLFPRSGVRFIAVNENYDSIKEQGQNNIIVPFKNMINDAYCADISVKVRSHLEIKRKRGDFVGAFAAYGYMKDEGDHNKLVIDSYAADVVRDIFKMKLEGMSAQAIGVKLNQSGILSPMEYKRFLGMRYNTTFKVNATAQWQSTTVKRVLTNAIYIGTLEQGKWTRPNYKVRKCTELPKEQWICTENAHDNIIDRRTFDTVQQLLKLDTRASDRTGNVFPLSGVIICGDCGGAMLRKNYKKKDGSPDPFYVCGKHRADTLVCSTHIISATDVENAVLKALRLHTSAVLDVEKALAQAESMAYRQDGVRKQTARLEAKQDEIRKYNDYRLSLYESYREGVIPQEDFVSFKSAYDVKITDAEATLTGLKEEIEKLAAGEAENHDWINKFRASTDVKTLERKTVAELIDCVKVYEGGRIEVRFRYYNEFARLIAAKEAA